MWSIRRRHATLEAIHSILYVYLFIYLEQIKRLLLHSFNLLGKSRPLCTYLVISLDGLWESEVPNDWRKFANSSLTHESEFFFLFS